MRPPFSCSKSGAILPLGAIGGAAVGTVAVWRYDERKSKTGFLPANQIKLTEPKLYITPSKLLYAGGLSWYLESLVGKKDTSPIINQSAIADTIQTLPSEHCLTRWVRSQPLRMISFFLLSANW
ncbi:hypothetical protein [Nostoc sp.]|uniref:hypothetical protein n=1 Tax=Nostoc sp. TaxID=1180 RepID=UPI002FFC0EF3